MKKTTEQNNEGTYNQNARVKVETSEQSSKSHVNGVARIPSTGIPTWLSETDASLRARLQALK
jgi:hypothetical protein